VAAPWVSGCSNCGIAGSNPLGAWMSVSCEFLFVRLRSLRLVDHSSRGVLPSVECLSVIKKIHRGGLRLLGLSIFEKKFIQNPQYVIYFSILLLLFLSPFQSIFEVFLTDSFTGWSCQFHAQTQKRRTRVSIFPLTCPVQVTLPVAMLLLPRLSGSFDHANRNTTSK
jgi:hypothetical protein